MTKTTVFEGWYCHGGKCWSDRFLECVAVWFGDKYQHFRGTSCLNYLPSRWRQYGL